MIMGVQRLIRKIEGLFSKRDEGEDMVVDVGSDDVVVDDHGVQRLIRKVIEELVKHKYSKRIFLMCNQCTENIKAMILVL